MSSSPPTTASDPAERRQTSQLGESAEALLAGALGLADGADLFPWQRRLLEAFRRGDVPRSLDVPTGLGKTATMAIWLVARLLESPLPRRLVYIVDRRAVVDQATHVAEGLRRWIGSDPALGAQLGLGDSRLPVSTLRGKLVDNREWMEDPAGPSIVVGTVDMIGSRLLFEGYRSSRKIRPYLAGLLGNDCLFVIDEAHLVPPFERLLERVALRGDDLRAEGGSAIGRPPPPRLLSLSATGRSRGGAPLELDREDLAHPVVAQRLRASKALIVDDLEPTSELPVVAADRAWEMTERAGEPRRVLLFLDRRVDAEKAKVRLRELAGLDKLKKGETPQAAVELLVGARRVFERQEAAERLAELGFLAGDRGAAPVPTFLVATSAGEVGIDLDADDMVGDLVPWERLVQRLGRVNRRGLGRARIVLLDPPPDPKAPGDRAERLQAARDLLAELPRVGGEEERDASPGSLRGLQQAAREERDLARLVDRASTPDPLYPELDRPTLEAWSMTSLDRHPGRPAIAPWLRGWVEDRPQTALVWRRHLPVTRERPRRAVDAYVERYFDAAPLHASELLEVETARVVDWLAKTVSRLVKKAQKTEGADPDLDDVVAFSRAGPSEPSRGWRLRDLDVSKKRLESVVPPGGELVVHADLAGLSAGLLDPRDDAPPRTMEDSSWREMAPVPYRLREEEAIAEERSPASGDGWIERERLPIAWTAEGEVTRWLIVDRLPQDAATEDDRSAGQWQTLAEHQDWAAERAGALAAAMDLSREAARVLRIAARLHDEGKKARRWQAAFRAARASDGAVYAKTPGPVNRHLLDGYRHELGSLPDAERDEELQALPDDHRDLVLHLIASHHGFARPVISTRGCEDAPPSALERRAQDIALRFWRLQARWGPWGLAWWEALLRAADQQASRANEQRARASRAGEED